MGTPLGTDALLASFFNSYSTFNKDLTDIVELLKYYKRRNEELELQLTRLIYERGRHNYDAETQTDFEDISVNRVDRRTISESGIPFTHGLIHNQSYDIWSFNASLGATNIFEPSDGWASHLNNITYPYQPWPNSRNETSVESDSSSERINEGLTDGSRNTISASAEDEFDENEIMEALRASENEVKWETAGPSKPVKQQVETKNTNKALKPGKRAKPISESSTSARRNSEKKGSSKHVRATLPDVFVGKWYPVRSCVIGGGNDGNWKDVDKKKKFKEPNVSFQPGSNDGLYTVNHKKFTIKDAIFFEHCGGQRCIVLKDRQNTILIRNKQHTYTFSIQDDKLLETYRDNGVEYKILSIKA